MRWTIGSCLTVALGIAACSVVNAPADPEDPKQDDVGGSGPGGSGPGGALPGGGGQGGAGRCGDGVVDADEECDDGGESESCDADCTARICGDGTLNTTAGEACDDGNDATGDACSDTCEITNFVLDPAGPPDTTTAFLLQPSVAVAEVGGEEHFVVAYVHYVGPNASEVRVAVFDGRGNQVGEPLTLSKTDLAVVPSIAVNSLGRVVVAWRDETADATQATIRYAVLNPGLTPTAFVDVIMPDSQGAVLYPRVVSSPADDGFCVQWIASTAQLRVRCLDVNGQVGSTATQSVGAVSLNYTAEIYGAHGLFAVDDGYLSQVVDGDQIVGQALTAIGQIDGPSFPIAQSPAMTGVAAVENGRGAPMGTGFISSVVLFGLFDGTYEHFRPHFRRFSAPGQPVEAPQALSGTATDQIGGWVVGQGSDTLIFYSSLVGTTGFECLLLGQRVSATGTLVGEPLDVTKPAVDECGIFAEAAVNAAGDVFIVWLLHDNDQVAPVRGTLQAALHPRLLPPK